MRFRNMLMNGVAFAPPGEGNPGSGAEDEQLGQLYSGFTPEELGLPGSQPQGEITVEEDSILDTLFPEEQEPEIDPANPPQPEQTEEDRFIATLPTQEAMTQQITQSIERFALPEDLIPSDFNPADPRQLRELIQGAMQHGIRASLATMFPPVEVAMRRMNAEMRRDMRAQMAEGINSNTESEVLAEIIPAVNDPATRDTVMNMFKQAKLTNKKPRDAATMARQALIALGINPNGRVRPQTDSSGQPRTVTSSALDLYAPFPPDMTTPRRPAQQQSQRPTQKVQQSLRR